MADVSAQPVMAPTPVSRAVYAGLMGAACLAASAGAGAATMMLGGDAASGRMSAAAVGAASVVTLLPAIFPDRGRGGTNFGTLVLVASVARMLALLTVAMVFDQTRALPRRPFWLGVLSGGAFVLIVECWVSIALIVRQGRGGAPVGSVPAP